jgi:DNA-binding SARP family transcriptional activator
MEFRILGPLEVASGGEVLDLGGQKQRALLAVLLLHANEVVSSDRLIEALWQEGPPDTAPKALQVYVSQLRKLLGRERLQTKAPGYLLRVDEGELDLARFRALRAEERPHEALSIWRGPPLGDFAYQRFAQAEIARLEEQRLACVEERVERDLAAGLHPDLVGELEALVVESPLRERLRRQLMLALYRSGRQAEALEAYQEARRALVDELGIEPSRELRELNQAILNQDPALDLVASRAPERDAARGAFVGREGELAELISGLEDAIAGHGRLFLLVGEPGIGKSRLADELIVRAWSRGARVLVGRCWEAGGAPAYWPWVQSMRTYLHEIEIETLRRQLGAGAVDLAQLLPELRDLFSDLGEPSSFDAESARFRLFEAVAGFLTRAAEARPLVLVLDDLHAADEPSLLLLQFLTRELGSSRILVLGACRDVDPTPTDPLTATLTELSREPVTKSMALTGLSEQDVARFIELTSGEAPTDEFVATIHDDTEGNPLFVGEIIRMLAAEGRLANADGPPLAIPQSVRDVIARRLRHLTEECNRILVLASVLGREFALDALATLASITEDELLETLDEAMTARVVSDLPGNPGRLRFAHLLIRDTLYEGLTTARRVRLHRLAVEALEALYRDEPGHHLAELANHSIAGSEFDKGLRYARRAANRTLALLAYEEAARLYETALDALDLSAPADESTRCELLLSLGEAEIRAGNSPAAKKAFLDAAEIARRLGLSRGLAQAAAGYGGRLLYGRAGDDDKLVPLLEDGLAALGDEDIELRTRLLARLAGALRDEHSRDRRDALSQEAVELARRTGNDIALAYALDGRAVAIIGPDTLAARLAIGTELQELGRRIGNMEQVVHGHIHRFVAQLDIGDIHAADQELEGASRVAEKLRQPAQLWQVCASRAMLAIAAGRLTEADDLLVPQAVAFGELAHPGLALPVYHIQRYTLCDFQGRLEEVEPAIQTLVATYPARPVFRCVLAHLQARLGQQPDAKRTFDELAKDDFAALPFDMEWLYGMSLLAETCALLRETKSAPVLTRLLLPWAAFNAVNMPEGHRGSVARYLGLLALTASRWDDAARYFEDALEMNERTGARAWLARTQDDYAQMLLARDHAGDRAHAQELLDQALTAYRELGMECDATKAPEAT